MRVTAGAPTAKRHARLVGLVFIDVLFAAVATKVLDESSSSQMSFVRATHLLLAAVLTATSWISYHNSTNRSQYKIQFFNLPLAQFTIELILVYLYWSMATSAEAPGISTSSILSESWILVVTYCVYVCWDQVALAMRKSTRYTLTSMAEDRPARRRVTVIFLGGYSVLAIAGSIADPHNMYVVGILDIFLAISLVLHRFIQQAVSHPANSQDASKGEGEVR